MLYDITRTVRPSLAVWPGDAPYQTETALSLDQGNSVNLTTLTLSPHTGTHADAYFHYERDGAHPVGKRSGALLPDDFAPGQFDGIERLLIHSHVSDMPDEVFPTEFPYLSVELIEELGIRGVKLIGLDSPSVDAFNSQELPCHHALRRNGMVNLETLLLRGVPDGDYELTALPLKLDLACGSPVRAILRRLEA
jgi:arylformamidase